MIAWRNFDRNQRDAIIFNCFGNFSFLRFNTLAKIECFALKIIFTRKKYHLETLQGIF